jgi:hypothetical protein
MMEGDNIRYTRAKDGRTVYAFLLRWPRPHPSTIELKGVRAASGPPITMLGLDHSFRYAQNGGGLTIKIPEWLAEAAKRPSLSAVAFRIQTEGRTK